jgi:hypothetical protein
VNNRLVNASYAQIVTVPDDESLIESQPMSNSRRTYLRIVQRLLRTTETNGVKKRIYALTNEVVWRADQFGQV